MRFRFYEAPRFSAVLLVTFAFLLACQPATERPANQPATQPPPPEAAVSAPPPATPSDSVRLHLDVPGQVRVSDRIPIAVRVENVTDRTLDLYLTGRPLAWDVIVTDATGAVVWRRLEGEIIATALRIETLAPGAALELDDAWDQRTKDGAAVAAGTYSVRAEILTETQPLVTPARELRIVDD
jgi:hypothetical protein